MSNTVTDVAGNGIMRQDYERNLLGNLTVKRTDSGDAAYAYDRLNQVTNALQTLNGEPDPRAFSYAFDPIGNRTTSAASAPPSQGHKGHVSTFDK